MQTVVADHKIKWTFLCIELHAYLGSYRVDCTGWPFILCLLRYHCISSRPGGSGCSCMVQGSCFSYQEQVAASS
uniref:Uncharacterized protein n=1 Tax=Rhizophora mucronata TaxID=61149 RepID=A0A2P2LJX9_RHIMU